jgi:hypothetical protein
MSSIFRISKLAEKKHKKNNPQVLTMTEFKVQIGNAKNRGFLSEKERLQTLAKNSNPFNSKHVLPMNSGVFFGRTKEIYKILSALRSSEKPASFNLIGENGIGKSSLLNQVHQSLAQEPELISIQFLPQNWGRYSADSFFKQLHYSIAAALKIAIENNENSIYTNLCNFIGYLGENTDYRIVLLIDDFEKMAGNLKFNPSFFNQLRNLAITNEYRFGLVISSCRELKELCLSQKLDETNFWSIFTHHEVLGLLVESDAKNLLLKPLEQTLVRQFKNPDKLWSQVKTLTGCHPLLIQIAASEFWNANDGHFQPNVIEVKMDLHSFMKDLFYQSSAENKYHWQMLIQAAGGKKIKESSTFYELCLRGLILERGAPFSQYFAKIIAEECEEKLNKPFEEIVNEITLDHGKNGEMLNRLWITFLGSPQLSNKNNGQLSNSEDEEYYDGPLV